MAKKNVRLKELTDADVRFVSLVNRSASRMPFRVVKSQKGGLDLSAPGFISKILKGEILRKTTKAEITAIGVYQYADSAWDEAVKKALFGAGFKTTNVQKQDDGTVVYVQEEGWEDCTFVRISDNMMVAVRGFDPVAQKDETSEDETSEDDADPKFTDLVAANGFYSGVGTAVNVLQGMILMAINDGDAGDDAAEDVEEAVDDFKDYVLALVKALPASAFKVDKELGRVLKDDPFMPPSVAPKEFGAGQAGWDKLDVEEKRDWLKTSATDHSDQKIPAKGASAMKTAKELMQKGVVSGNNALPDIQALMKAAAPDESISPNEWTAMSDVDKFACWTNWMQNRGTPAKVLPVSEQQKDTGAHGGGETATTTAEKAEKPAAMTEADWNKLDDAGKMTAHKADLEKTQKAEADEKAKTAKKAEDDAKAKKAEEDAAKNTLQSIVEGLGKLTTAVTGLTTKVEGQEKTVTDLKKQVDETARKADTAASALKSTVAAQAGSGDVPAGTVTEAKKSDDLRSGCFDTGSPMFRRQKRDAANGPRLAVG